MTANNGEIDEDLHSRQLAVYGRDTMRKMASAHILISGLRGLGIEIAKNIILAGVRAVSLQDGGVVEMADLSSNFYLTQQVCLFMVYENQILAKS